MNKHIRMLFVLTCILGVFISAGITAYWGMKADRNVFGEWLAPIRVNMEIDRNYAANVLIYSPSASWRPNYPMYMRSGQLQTNQNVGLYAELDTHAFHRNIYLKLPKAEAAETINAIDNISVFIGNKLFYFSNAEIKQFTVTNEDDYSLFLMPNLHYTKSLFVKNWANYYGDFNLALKAAMSFFLYPFKFAVSYLFLLALAFLYRKEIGAACRTISKKSGFWTAAALVFVLVLGFALRVNGYVRYSGWSDEIYSAVNGANPNLPLFATFSDSGNPPFYFILLRCWFKIFGWSEEAGTMFSVILGSLAIPALFFMIKENYGAKTALMASFFMAISGFAIGYSQEMRAYILKVLMAPVMAMFFFRYLKKQTIVNLIPYTLMSILMANTHYYGILFIIANFLFYCLHEAGNRSFTPKKLLCFLSGNIIAALSFMPYFLYQMLVVKSNFQRDDKPEMQHIALIFIIAVLAVVIFMYRKKINLKCFGPGQAAFFLYVFSMPILIYTLSFFISFVKPMIYLKYLFPISFPFFLASCAILISLVRRNRKLQYISVFLVWAFALALYEGKAGITGDGYSYYRQARAYIAADAAAHPDQKSCMLDNAPQNAAYYGFSPLPKYMPNSGYDVVYVYNDIFSMKEDSQLQRMKENNLSTDNMLAIIPDDEVAIFKKYLP